MSKKLKITLFILGGLLIIGSVITIVLLFNYNSDESDPSVTAADKAKIEQYLKISIPENAKILNYYYSENFGGNDFLATRIRVDEEDYRNLQQGFKTHGDGYYDHSDLDEGKYMYDEIGLEWWDDLVAENKNKELCDYYHSLGSPVRDTGVKTAYQFLHVFKVEDEYDLYFTYYG